jgi:adenosylhomocysteine nucleosidase
VQPGREGTARICVLTILPEEFAAAEAALGITDEVGDTACYCRVHGDKKVILKQAADRTNPAAEEAVMELIELFRPEIVVVCGIGGGISGRDDIAKGDVVVASYLHYNDFRKLSEQGDEERYIAYDQPSTMIRDRHVHPVARKGEWASRITETPPAEGFEPKVVVGPIVAGEKLMGRPGHPEQKRAIERYTDAVAVDMESYGAGRGIHKMRVAVDYDPLLLVVRGISDLVRKEAPPEGEEDNSAERRQWKRYACNSAAAFTSAMIDRLLQRTDLRKELTQ